jgi:hypothetical protein
MTRFERSDGFQGAELVDVDMSRSSFREVDLSGARMRGVLLIDADIDGAINGLRVNGVEVAPLVEAELDRLHPERAKLRPTTPDGMREAWTVVESFWGTTMARAVAMPEADLHRSVDGEWSFAETLRHLVFVTDSWFAHAVLGQASPFHPLGVPASFMTNGAEFGIDPQAAPSYAEVTRVRADRMAQVREFLTTFTQDDLDRVREPNDAPGWPPPAARSAIECLHVLFNEEWTHHQFAVRDLDVLDSRRADS